MSALWWSSLWFTEFTFQLPLVFGVLPVNCKIASICQFLFGLMIQPCTPALSTGSHPDQVGFSQDNLIPEHFSLLTVKRRPILLFKNKHRHKSTHSFSLQAHKLSCLFPIPCRCTRTLWRRWMPSTTAFRSTTGRPATPSPPTWVHVSATWTQAGTARVRTLR